MSTPVAKPTLAETRQIVETDLDDVSLQLLIDAAEADVVELYGAAASLSEEILGGDDLIFPARRIESAADVFSVVETIGVTDTTLATNDWELAINGWALRRLSTGTNGRSVWGDSATITVAITTANGARTDLARRKNVIIDLVRLAVTFNPLASESVGEYSASFHDDIQLQRNIILSRLGNRSRAFA